MEEIRNNFIHDIIDEDLREDPNLKIHTRFIPLYLLYELAIRIVRPAPKPEEETD